MNITDLSDTYIVRYMGADDVASIVELCKGNHQYYEHCPPFVTKESVRKDMSALPPRNVKEDKHYVGFYDGEKLVAVLDIIERCPNQATVFIGFFMLDKEYQGRGIGTSIISRMKKELKRDFSYIRLGYVETNTQAKGFWIKNGFEHTGLQSREELYTVKILEIKL